MSKKYAYIVRDIIDVESALQKGKSAEILFLCTQKTVAEYCLAYSYPFQILQEEALESQYSKINIWAAEQAMGLAERFKEGSETRLFFETNFMLLNSLFVQVLKNTLILDEIIRKEKINEIVLFKEESSPLFLITLEYARFFGKDLSLTVLTRKARKGFSLATSAKTSTTFVLSKISLLLARLRMDKAVKQGARLALVSGAMNHLSPVLNRLDESGACQTVYFENAFNLEKFIFCLKKRIAFYIVSKPSGRAARVDLPGSLFESSSIQYEGTDYSEILNAVFKELNQRGFFDLAFDSQKLGDVFRKYGFSFVLLDEDWAMRRMIMLMAEDLEVPCYVVSHGVPASFYYDENKPSLKGRYRSGITFTNSDFEKGQYGRHYYDPFRLMVTGVPRYDEIPTLKKAAIKNDLPKRNKTILYCGANMGQLDFDNIRPWLGLKNIVGESTRKYTEELLEIVSSMKGVSLKIKPHYNQENDWQKYLKQRVQLGEACQLLSHKDNIFKLEAEADVILTIESSVICEAIMFEKPVIVLNYTKEDLTGPYEKHGLIEHIRNKEQLRSSLQKCLYDKDYLGKLADRRREVFKYYSGPLDGHNTIRVADHILDHLGSSKEIRRGHYNYTQEPVSRQ